MTVGYDEAVMLKDWAERQLELLSKHSCSLAESEVVSIRKRKSYVLEPTGTGHGTVSETRLQFCKWYRTGQIEILKELMIDILNLLSALDKYEDASEYEDDEGTGTEEENCDDVVASDSREDHANVHSDHTK